MTTHLEDSEDAQIPQHALVRVAAHEAQTTWSTTTYGTLCYAFVRAVTK